MKTASKIVRLIAAIQFIIVGFVLLNKPLEFVLSIPMVLGSTVMMGGIMHMMYHVSDKHFYPSVSWTLVSGLTDILIGAIFFSHIDLTTFALPYIFGFWMMLMGIGRIVLSIELARTAHFKYWWMNLVTGILVQQLGITMLYMPQIGFKYFPIILPAYMLYYGVFLILEGISMKNYKH